MTVTLPSGKGMFLWQVTTVLNSSGGTIDGMVGVLLELGLDIVSIKVAGGIYPYNGDLKPAVTAIQDAGIRVYGWHYIYGYNNPDSEANIAIRQIEDLNLDGFEIDAEAGYKNYSVSQAKKYSEKVRAKCVERQIPLGLSSYRYPNYHMELPWAGFLPWVDYFAPQVYWQPYTGPVRDLDLSIERWLTLADQIGVTQKPFFPAGRAYVGDGYPLPGPPGSELTAYMDHCKAGSNIVCEIPGFSFWSVDNLYTHSGGQERFVAIADFSWDSISDKEKLDRLWDHHPEIH